MNEPTPYHDDPTAPPSVRFGRAKLELMRRAKYAQKERKAGVPYLTVDAAAIVAIVRPAFLDLGFTWGPIGVDSAVPVDTFETKGGTTSRLVLFYTFRLTHVESGHFEDYTAPGEGADMGDKRAGKCSTYAQKYALMQMLLIETGTDDPDRHDMTAKKKEQHAEQQRQRNQRPAPGDPGPDPARDPRAEQQKAEGACRQQIRDAKTLDDCGAIERRLGLSLDSGRILIGAADTLRKELDERRAVIRAGLGNRTAPPSQPTQPETAPEADKPAKRGKADELTPVQKRDQIRYSIDHAITKAAAELAMHKAEKLHADKVFGEAWTTELRTAFLDRIGLLASKSPQFIERYDLLRMMKGSASIRSLADKIKADHSLTAPEKAELATLCEKQLATATFGEAQDAQP